MKQTHYDVAIIGSGYGGLGAALHLAEQGKKIALFEALKYPGGCASTFRKDGCLFEAGATLFSGFHNQGLFHKWMEKHNFAVAYQPLDPIIDFRSQDWSLQLSSNRQTTIDRFCALEGAPTKQIIEFFAYQEKIANILWPIFDDAARLPPFSVHSFGWHMKRSWKYPSLLSVMNRSLFSVLQQFQLTGFQPLMEYCNALCQITIQCATQEAEALFALSAMDYLFRGTGHIYNGIGQLSSAMVTAIENCGGDVFLSNKVKKLNQNEKGWEITSRKGVYTASRIVANILPQQLTQLVPQRAKPSKILQLEDSLQAGWGAGMLYLVIKDNADLPHAPHHYQCIFDPKQPLQEGNHIFCSLSGRDEEKAPEGFRTATVSTHIPMRKYSQHQNQGEYIHHVQQKMRETIKRQIPEIFANIYKEYPGSPRTYRRFTQRENGLVGGIPKIKGWHNYRHLGFTEPHSNLWLVGDTVFPGQSTLATTLGGIRLARFLLRK